MPKCQFLDEPADFFNLLSDPNIEVSAILPINDDIMGVKYRNHQEIDITLPHTNVVHAAYTTAHARLKLYSYLEFLQRRVLYFDTDSVIFTSAPGEVNPPTGDFLGDLTDELACHGPGSYIREFISGGAKNYGYVAVDPSGKEHVTMKVKGFRLDHATGASVNMDVLKKMLGVGMDDDDEVVDVVTVRNPCAIRRLRDHTVVSRGETKTYRVVYDKRRRTSSYDTLPYGYV